MSEAPDPESRDHEASEKRLADAIERGDTPFSHDLVLLGATSGVYIALIVMEHAVTSRHVGILGALLDRSWDFRLATGADAASLVAAVAGAVIAPWAIIAFSLFATSLVIGSGAQRPKLVWKRLKVDPSRLDPAKGLERLLGKKGLAAFAKMIAKSCAALLAAGVATHAWFARMAGSASRDPGAFAGETLRGLERIAVSVAGVLACFALLDFVLARLSWRKRLRMTRQEVKDEAKEAEGDPLVKTRMRSLALDRARKRMLSDVATATMVIANPTHYAVALRYLREEGGAPVVVAKGQDIIALKIRGEAEQRQIPVIEQPELARALYRSVDVGQLIPPEFYRAVAEIVNFLATRRLMPISSP